MVIIPNVTKQIPLKDFYTELMQYMADQKIAEIEEVKEWIATVEQRAKINVKDYLGFGAIDTPIKTCTQKSGMYCGEFNADRIYHGRGIEIVNDGYIRIGYW